MISPYSKPGVDDQYYTQLNMVKTVEQILGIQPMNQEDYAAEPMYGAFTEQPNFAPYTLAPEQIPLNLGAPGGPTTFIAAVGATHGRQRKTSAQQGVVPATMRVVYNAWRAGAGSRRPSTTSTARTASTPQQRVNRYDWYSAHDWKIAYPGDPKIYTPNQVPGPQAAGGLPRRRLARARGGPRPTRGRPFLEPMRTAGRRRLMRRERGVAGSRSRRGDGRTRPDRDRGETGRCHRAAAR